MSLVRVADGSILALQQASHSRVSQIWDIQRQECLQGIAGLRAEAVVEGEDHGLGAGPDAELVEEI